MTPFFFDTETYLIRPGRLAPKVVCVQSKEGIALRDEGLDLLESALEQGRLIVAHNTAFDAAASIATRPALLPKWLRAYDNDLVTCTMVREKLIRIALGRDYGAYSLEASLERHKIPSPFRTGDKRGEGWRLRYSELDGVPVDQWPDDARRYALADMVVQELYYAQQKHADLLADEYRQARAHFVLHLTSCSGMRVDRDNAREFANAIADERRAVRARLQEVGLVRATGSKNLKAAKERVAAAFAARGLEVPLTDKGNVKTDADTCASVDDPILIDFARYTTLTTLKTRTERLLLAGDLPIQPRYNVLVATGRTSCSAGNAKPGRTPSSYGDQVQNLMREPGLRECYVARPGYVLCSVDFSTAELHSLAQVCTWMGLDSRLVTTLNEGRDPHISVACQINGWSYDWAAKHKKIAEVKAGRQAGKALNFGFPGGLGIDKFRMFAQKTYDVTFSDREARTAKARWMQTYPEMQGYFAHISQLTRDENAALTHFKSLRRRGRVRYTSAANSYFQGHTADMAKDAGWRIAKSIYDGGVLSGCRLWAFIHDEWILEVPRERAHECAMEVVRLMEEAGKEWCPDVPCRAEPALSYHWRKGAEPTYRDGELIPWEERPEIGAAVVPGLGTDPVPLDTARASRVAERRLSWYFGYEL